MWGAGFGGGARGGLIRGVMLLMIISEIFWLKMLVD